MFRFCFCIFRFEFFFSSNLCSDRWMWSQPAMHYNNSQWKLKLIFRPKMDVHLFCFLFWVVPCYGYTLVDSKQFWLTYYERNYFRLIRRYYEKCNNKSFIFQFAFVRNVCARAMQCRVMCCVPTGRKSLISIGMCYQLFIFTPFHFNCADNIFSSTYLFFISFTYLLSR